MHKLDRTTCCCPFLFPRLKCLQGEAGWPRERVRRDREPTRVTQDTRLVQISINMGLRMRSVFDKGGRRERRWRRIRQVPHWWVRWTAGPLEAGLVAEHLHDELRAVPPGHERAGCGPTGRGAAPRDRCPLWRTREACERHSESAEPL